MYMAQKKPGYLKRIKTNQLLYSSEPPLSIGLLVFCYQYGEEKLLGQWATCFFCYVVVFITQIFFLFLLKTLVVGTR